MRVNNDAEHRKTGSVTPIDPHTGKPGTPVAFDDPYNMYFTPDGKSAIVVAEALKPLGWCLATTPTRVRSRTIGCGTTCRVQPQRCHCSSWTCTSISYQMDFGAAAAKYIDAFLQNIRWEALLERMERARRCAQV